MHDQSKPMAADCGDSCQSPADGLAERTDALRPVVSSGTQHGSRLADSPQPSPCEGSSRCEQGDVEGIRPSGDGNGSLEGHTCQEERLASVGHEENQRRQPVHPKGQENLVKPHGPVSTDNVLRLLEHQQYRCALTGRPLTPDTASLDHIIPVRCGGEHLIENAQVLHRDVNRAKATLTNDEFVQLCREVVEFDSQEGLA